MVRPASAYYADVLVEAQAVVLGQDYQVHRTGDCELAGNNLGGSCCWALILNLMNTSHYFPVATHRVYQILQL